MEIRQFTILTNSFSNKLEYHLHMLSRYIVYYTFVSIHNMLKVSP